MTFPKLDSNTDLDSFVNEFESEIKALYASAKSFIPRDNYPDDDVYTEILTSVVLCCILGDMPVFDGSINQEILLDYDNEFITELASFLLVSYTLWVLVDLGNLKRTPDGRFTEP